MLTEQQLAQRQLGLGGSEVGTIVGVNTWGEPLDVFVTKRRGKDGELPPILKPEPQRVGIDKRTVGQMLEGAIVDLYLLEQDDSLYPDLCPTYQHPDHPWVLDTPDRLMRDAATTAAVRGLECKAVGWRMADDWRDDSMPMSVMCQVQWGMHTLGLKQWDVAALIGGTDFRIRRIDRDDDLITDLHNACERFWFDHIVANVPPEPDSGAAAMRYMSRRFPDSGKLVRDVTGDGEIAALVADLATQKALAREAKDHIASIQSQLCERVGEAKGLKGPWGSFQWPTRDGSVSWKSVAEHLAGGAIDPAVLDQFRGADYRKPGFYPRRRKK